MVTAIDRTELLQLVEDDKLQVVDVVPTPSSPRRTSPVPSASP
jgi:hypothetical protein